MFNRKKYEPQTVADLVFADEDTRQRVEDYANGERTDHALLHGPMGTGKSSTARVIAEARVGVQNGLSTQAYEGASFKESDLDKILNDWNWQRLEGAKFPVSVINEIDLLPPAMLEKLKAFMDQCGHQGQIIGTTNHEYRLSYSHRDRFDIIEMPALPGEAFEPRVREMLANEGVQIADETIRDVLAPNYGSWRDALSATQDMILDEKRKSKP